MSYGVSSRKSPSGLTLTFALLGLTLQLHFGYGRGWVIMTSADGYTSSTAGGPPSPQGEGLAKAVRWSLVIGVLFACSDEFHQRFVPGRGPAVRDVCIDSVGVMIGIGVMLLILGWIRKRARRAAG